jgi:hypothetical protein
MPEPLPARDQRDHQITLQDVRDFIMDRTAADNPLEMDLEFSDDDMLRATRLAAMRFNEINPRSFDVDWRNLPYGNLFLCGIAYALYLSKMQYWMRQDIDYNAGNANIEITKRRIEHLKGLVDLFRTEFDEKAYEQKRVVNVENCYAHF